MNYRKSVKVDTLTVMKILSCFKNEVFKMLSPKQYTNWKDIIGYTVFIAIRILPIKIFMKTKARCFVVFTFLMSLTAIVVLIDRQA